MNSLTLLLALASAVPSTHAAAIDGLSKRGSSVRAGYKNTFWDDFSGAIGSLPSSTNWIIDTGTQYPGGEPQWGNNEVQTYTKDRANIEIITGGYLKMTPRKAANGAWTSSRIETKRTDFVAKAGGKMLIETRLKLGNAAAATQQGIWPAFWALGGDFRGNYHNWPKVTEWDILEVINGQTKLYSTIHCGVAPGGPCNEYVGLGTGGSNTFSRNVYHVLGFEVDRKGKASWREEKITWFLDGKVIFYLKGATMNDADAWMRTVQKGHFLLFNVAIGGNFAGPPNAKTLGGPGAGMEIDWVGVWNT